jgi:ferric-dicitrate binding protein FerR (iron transport regulator)
MMGCSKHQTPVSDCAACTRVAHAREQLELSSRAEPHVDWSRVSLRWRNAPQREPRRFAILAGVFAGGLALALALIVFLPIHRTPQVQVERKMAEAVAKAPPTETPARATAVVGDVRVAPGKDWLPLGIGDMLHAGARLETESGRASLQWGAGTGAALADKTELTLDKLNSLKTLIELNRGEVTLRVSHREAAQSFAVQTPGHVVEVRGTWFTVARDAGRTTVTVCEGRVVVSTRGGVEQATLERGEKASFRDGAILASPRAAEKVSCVDPWLLQWQALLAPLHLGGDPADLTLDGHSFGRSPMALMVTPGRHMLQIARLGVKEMREIVVAPNGDTVVTIEKMDLRPRANEISDEVVKKKDDIGKCYSRALKRDPTIKGTFKIRLTVAADGHVRRSEIFESELADIDVEECITTAARSWQFPTGPAVTSETTLELQ